MADFEALFHQAPAGYLITRIDGTIIEVNDTFLRWTGLERSSVQGTNLLTLLPAGDRSTYTTKALPQLETDGTFSELALDIIGNTGDHHPAMVSAIRSTSGPGTPAVDRIIAVSTTQRRSHENDLDAALRQRDHADKGRLRAESDSVTHQNNLAEKEQELEIALQQNRRNDSLLSTILNTVDIGIAVVDDAGNAIIKNNCYQHDLEHATPAGCSDVAFTRLLVYGSDRSTPVPPRDIPLLRAARGESFTDELIWIGRPGDQRALSVSAQSISKTEDFTGSVIAYGDVTLLINALAAKADFIANVSHELRTPLTSIIGYIDLVLDDPELPEEVVAPLNVALRNCERLMQLVSNLLSTAAGYSVITPQPADLAAILRECISSATQRAERSNVQITADLPPTLPMVLDPRRIAQALDHLLTNAINFSPNGGHVAINAHHTGEHIRVEVTDTGIGMTPEDLQNAFTNFFRSYTAIKAAIPGAGLGLGITKNIVSAHHGTITLTSKPGHGTTAAITLPEFVKSNET